MDDCSAHCNGAHDIYCFIVFYCVLVVARGPIQCTDGPSRSECCQLCGLLLGANRAVPYHVVDFPFTGGRILHVAGLARFGTATDCWIVLQSCRVAA